MGVKQFLLSLLIMLVILRAFYFLSYQPTQPPINNPAQNSIINLTIHGVTIKAEVSDTETKRSQGLSGHAPLASDGGMLFIFPQPGIYPFWMKDMLFSIDIIWIDAQKKVVGFSEDLSPDTYPKIFPPPSPILYALEVSAGFVKRQNIAIGDLVSFSTK